MSILLGKNIKFYKFSLYCIAFFTFFLIWLFSFSSQVKATTFYPTLVGHNTADVSNGAFAIAASGNYVYVTQDGTWGANSLMIYNISNPSSPTLAGHNTADSSESPAGIAISGNYAYVTQFSATGANSLMIYNISNPTSPSLVGANTADASSHPEGIAVSGNYAYVAEYGNTGVNSLMIYNISNPASPTLVGHNTADSSKTPKEIAVSGNYAYVAEYGNTGVNSLMIYNISNPASPTLVGHNTADSSNTPMDIAVSGNYAYIAEHGNSGANSLMIYNISNPASPTLAGSNTSDSSASPSGLVLSGNYVYITEPGHTGGNTLMIYNISNPSSPTLAGANTADSSNQPWGIAFSGTFAYLAESYNNGVNSLMIYDVSTLVGPNNPINLQARLSNSSDVLLGNNGTYNILFCIYTISSGGTNCTASGTTVTLNSAVYGEVYTSAVLYNGSVNIQLGSGGNGSAGTFPNFLLNSGINYYFGASVGSSGGSYDTEMTPRLIVGANNYTLNSGYLDGYTASQTPIANQIPVLDSNGYLNLSATNPQINASIANTLTLQGGSGTGNIQFFNNNNYITNAGNITLSGSDNILSGTPISQYNGILSIGNGGFSGPGGNNYNSNSSNGSFIALNTTGFTGNALDFQKGAIPEFSIDYNGGFHATGGGAFFDPAGTTSKIAVLSLGNASSPSLSWWCGPGSGCFNGSGNGTLLAGDESLAFTGNLIDLETAGNSTFKLDYTGNITTIGTITQNYNTNNTANTINLTGQATSLIGLNINQNVTYTSTANDSGNLVNINRSLISSGVTTTVTNTGPLVYMSSTCTTASSGTCNDTSAVLALYQNNQLASGQVEHIENNGSAKSLDIEQQPTYTSGSIINNNNLVNINRNLTSQNSGTSVTNSGSILALTDNCTVVSSGTCADSTTIMTLNQSDLASTGQAEHINNNGLASAMDVQQTPTFTTGSPSITSNQVVINRSLTVNGTSQTVYDQGVLLGIANNCTGACTADTSTILSMTQSDASGTGKALSISNSGSGYDIADTNNNWNITKAGIITSTSTSTAALNFTGTNAGITFTNGGSFTATTGNIYLNPASGSSAIVQIGVGGAGSANPDYLAVDVKNTTGDPTGANGEIYYNSYTGNNIFRCYQNNAWTNCTAASNAWSSITNPADNLSLSMTTNTSAISFASTAASDYGQNMFNLSDYGGSTSGTGYLFSLSTAASSVLHPLTVTARGNQSIYVGTTGLVGINTTSPIANTALTVVGNISDLANLYISPKLIGANSADSSGTPLGNHAVAVVGKYAYVAEGSNSGANTLMVYDISNPASPTVIGANASDTSKWPSGIAISGKYAYVTQGYAGAGSLMVYDISNPHLPVAVGSNPSDSSSWPYDIVIVGHYAYVAENGTAGANSFMIYDISNPTAPIAIGSNTADSSNRPIALTVSGNYAYLVDHSNWGAYSLMIYNISNPSAPTLAGHNTADSSGGADGIFVQGRYAYVAEANSGVNSLMIYDISDPTNPTLVGHNTADASGAAGSVIVSGNYAFVTNWNAGANSLMVYNISTPATPVLVGSNTANASSGSWGIALSGRYLYATEGYNTGANTLMVYDVSGIETSSILAHSLETGSLNVDTNATIANNLSVGTWLNLGQGGIYSSGDIDTSGAFVQSFSGTTGNAFSLSLTGLATATNGLNISQAPAYTSTTGNTGNLINLSRNPTISSGTLTDSGALLSVTDNMTSCGGTCVDTANLLSLTESYASASGALIKISNANTTTGIDVAGTGNTWSFSNTGLITTSNTTATALTLGGTGSDITFANGGTISTTSGIITFQMAGSGTTAAIQIGTGAGSGTPDLLALDVKNTTGDPAGAIGNIYYNSYTGTFRCYQNTAWTNCIGTTSNPPWSSFTAPTIALAVTMNAYTTNLSFASSGAGNVFTISDTSAGSSSNGYLFGLSTAASSNLKLFDVIAQTNQAFSIDATGAVNIGTSSQFQVSASGSLTTTGSIAQTYATTTGTATTLALTGQATTANAYSVSQTPTYSSSVTNTGNLINISRNPSVSSSYTLTETGALISATDTCAVTAGTCTDSSNLLYVNESEPNATGNIINISNAGTGYDIADGTNWNFSKTGNLTDTGAENLFGATPPLTSNNGLFNLGNSMGNFSGSSSGTAIASMVNTTIGDYIDFQNSGYTVFKVDNNGNMTANRTVMNYYSNSATTGGLLVTNNGTWSGNVNGTAFGENVPNTFTGNLIDAQIHTSGSMFLVDANGTISFNGHLISNQATWAASNPTVNGNVLGTSGSGAQITITVSTDNDVNGYITIKNGTSCTTSCTTGSISSAEIPFTKAYATAPTVIISPAGATTANAIKSFNLYTTSDTTGFSIMAGTAINGSAICNTTSCVLNYYIIQ